MGANLEQNDAQPKSSWLLGLFVMMWLGCALGGLFIGARGHAGDNAGRASIVALLNRQPGTHASTNVFGCSLFASAKS